MSDSPQPDLPSLHHGQLDAELFRQYINELRESAQVGGIQLKLGPQDHCDGQAWDLEQAAASLSSGRARGMQVAYRYDGCDWIDTVLVAAGGYRVVRMEQQA